MDEPSLQPDPWAKLKRYTSARIGLGRAGVSIPSNALLNFKMDHAHARDAVYSTLNIDELATGIHQLNLTVSVVKSQVNSRIEYLQRPDLGRKLSKESSVTLSASDSGTPDALVIIIADGLSASAVNNHALPLLRALLLLLTDEVSVSHVVIVDQGRVAISDEIGQLLHAESVLILLGERPGLTSPDSMGAYFTYGPRVGNTDESRNCVSNIRPEGLSYQVAASKIFYLISESRKRKISGVALKDHTDFMGLKK